MFGFGVICPASGSGRAQFPRHLLWRGLFILFGSGLNIVIDFLITFKSSHQLKSSGWITFLLNSVKRRRDVLDHGVGRLKFSFVQLHLRGHVTAHWECYITCHDIRQGCFQSFFRFCFLSTKGWTFETLYAKCFIKRRSVTVVYLIWFDRHCRHKCHKCHQIKKLTDPK